MFILTWLFRSKNKEKIKLPEFVWTKRQRFAFLTIFATLGLIIAQLISKVDFYLPIALVLVSILALLTYLVLQQDLQGIRRITSVILISYYSLAVVLFYFLLPVRWLTRLPIAIAFGVGFYAILLTENIFNVATNRSIQLLRAASSVGFLLTIATVIFLFDTVMSLRLAFWANALLFFVIVFPLAFHSLWYMNLDVKLNRKILLSSVLLGFTVSEVGLALSFWPTNTTMLSIFLAAFFYLVVGLTQQDLIESLFSKIARDFFVVAIAIFILVFLTSSWGG